VTSFSFVHKRPALFAQISPHTASSMYTGLGDRTWADLTKAGLATGSEKVKLLQLATTTAPDWTVTSPADS
jgi:hypothetical protein